MNLSRTATITRAVVIGALVAIAGAGCASVTSPAAEVNGVVIERSDVQDLLTELTSQSADDPNFASQFEATEGVMPASTSRQMVTLLIQNEMLRQALQDRGLEISEADLAGVAVDVEPLGIPRLDMMFDSLEAQDRILQQNIEPGENPFVDFEISVDPRYGVWGADPQNPFSVGSPPPLTLER